MGMEAMSGTANEDLTALIASAVDGEDVAFARIVAANHDDMRRVCVFITRDHELADDAVQAASSIAWRKLGSLKEPDRLRPWLTSVAVNEARKLLKKRIRRSEREVIMDLSASPGGGDPAAGISSLDLRAAMGRLDPDDRALLAMRYIAGFNATELATAIGISPSGTRNRLERLLARLRQELSDG
jgi:RNA polymerase sigma factor (sigma-70 family)